MKRITLSFLLTILLFCNISFAQTFTVGSNKDDVLRIQGTPNSYDPKGISGLEELQYKFSTVYISRSSKKVVSWNDISNVLKVKYKPGKNITNLNFITVGSHKDD